MSNAADPFSASIIPFEVPEQVRAFAERGVSHHVFPVLVVSILIHVRAGVMHQRRHFQRQPHFRRLRMHSRGLVE